MPKRRRKERIEEYEERIRQALALLEVVSNDFMTPRNIRLAAKEAIKALKSSTTYAVRAADAISILDEISQDPNMPQHTRVRVWNIVSVLEGIRD
ncbi:TPA: hypothetical protein EYP44_01745 [Candidatus Bathyarchaeota archaeon]|nr:hypothetical protein [Candidatus Bathyarchaeota archaeon]